MAQNSISINDHTMFVINAHADLNLQGWDRLEVQPLADDRMGLSMVQDGDTIRIRSNSDLDLTLPVGAAIMIERASGDANLRNLMGGIHVQRAGGDFSAQEIGALDVQAIGGDCVVVGAAGPLAIQRVGGDFQGSNLAGPVRLDGVGGDAMLKVTGGAVHIRAGGDLGVWVEAADGENIRAQANGDVVIGLALNENADLDLNSRGRDIKVEIAGGSEEIEKRFHHLVLGDGSQKISVEAGGDIWVTDNLGDLGERFDGLTDLADELIENWKSVDESHAERMEDFSHDFNHRAEDLTDRINKRVEDAMRQADTRIQESMKRLERRTRRLERHGFDLPIPPVSPRRPAAESPAGKKAGASEEEKMLILKMLQEKKITVEEAEKLLEALEG